MITADPPTCHCWQYPWTARRRNSPQATRWRAGRVFLLRVTKRLGDGSTKATGRLVPPERPGSLDDHQGSEGNDAPAAYESHIAWDLNSGSEPGNHSHRDPDQNPDQWRWYLVLEGMSGL